MADFQKKKLTDIIGVPGLDGTKVEITEWASVGMTLRRRGDYRGFIGTGSQVLLFMGSFAHMDEYGLLLESTHSGEPATLQGILRKAPQSELPYCLRVSGVRYKDGRSSRYRE